MKPYVPGYILKGVTTTNKHGKNTTSVAIHEDYSEWHKPVYRGLKTSQKQH
jgi:hypothetical protein